MAHCKNCFCKDCSADRERITEQYREAVKREIDCLVFDHFRRKFPKAGEGIVRVSSIVIKYNFLYEKEGKTKKHHTIKAVDTGGPLKWSD